MFYPSLFLSAHPSKALSPVEKNHYTVLWASCLCIMLSHSHERGGKRSPELRWYSLSRWFVHPDGEGKNTRCKWEKNNHCTARCSWLWSGYLQRGRQMLVTMCLKMWIQMRFQRQELGCFELCGMSHALGSGIVIPRHSLWEPLPTVITGRLYK